VPTVTLEEAFTLVAAGSADVAIANRYFGDYFFQQYGLRKTPIVFQPSTLFYAVAKGRNADVLAAIDRRLKAWIQEPSSPYYQAISHWTQPAPAPVSSVPLYAYVAIATIGALLLLAIGGVLLLARQVRARTRRLRQANAALSAGEQKYRELVELANIIILRWTNDGRITFLNEFGLRFFGYTEAEVVGRPVFGTIVPTTDTGGEDLAQLIDRIAADPTAFEQNVNENVRRDGQRVWVAWTNTVVRDSDERVVEILSVGTDITGAKRAEEAIRDLNTSLELRVAERTADLAVARDRAEAADLLKSAFLATMSHELRTPLNSIIGFTGIILQELAGPLNGEQRKQLEMVRDSARHLLALINDVLDISKIEAGQLDVRSEPIDLRASILKAAAIVQPLADKKNLALKVAIAPEIHSFVSDERRVEQILLNLLNNAIKFTERGTITLTAEVRPDRRPARGSAVRISIADTGIGIKPEDMDKLFQPFRQVDTGLARQHEGTGLGLAICRRLAELLGGDIEATSEWGKGSSFTLTLPVVRRSES
jgi:PAS domain S-box-containing protein